MNITVNDLDNNTTLDQQAMTSLLGGWHNHGRKTYYKNRKTGRWSRWMSSGVPFTKKRYRNRYRTKVVEIRQHQRDYQFRTKLGFGI